MLLCLLLRMLLPSARRLVLLLSMLKLEQQVVTVQRHPGLVLKLRLELWLELVCVLGELKMLLPFPPTELDERAAAVVAGCKGRFIGFIHLIKYLIIFFFLYCQFFSLRCIPAAL